MHWFTVSDGNDPCKFIVARDQVSERQASSEKAYPPLLAPEDDDNDDDDDDEDDNDDDKMDEPEL